MALVTALVVGLVLSSFIGWFAYRRGSLTRSGVVGAIVTGTAIFGMGGFVPGLMLVAFFVSSTALSHFKARSKEQFAEKFQKGSRRDLGQALANGGWAAVLAIAYGIAVASGVDARWTTLLLSGIIGALATVTADTWATEIGVLSQQPPRMVTTGRVVPPGTSGAVTTLGTATALAGSLFIGVVAVIGSWALLWIPQLFQGTGPAIPGVNAISPSELLRPALVVIAIAGISGLVGSLFDSLLGATLQAIYFCEYDEVQTEQRIHSCGRETRLVRGWTWLDNDWVNFTASVIGSVMALGLANLWL